MDLPINFMTWILSALPIIVLLVLMVRFQWGAAEATPIALAIVFTTAFLVFKAPVNLVALESAKGIWNALIVLIVIWPAIFIYEVTHEAGAFEVFKNGMQKFSPNELLQVIAIGWVFVSFLQGVTGFGVPVAVGAPLLTGIGLVPLWAVVIPLLGHAWANTFGTLSVAWQALIFQTGITDVGLINSIALWAASFLWIFNIITGLSISWFYGKKEAVKKGLPAVLIISTIHGGGQLILSQINQTVANFVMTCIALGVIFLLGKTKWYNQPWSIKNSRIMDRSKTVTTESDNPNEMNIHQAFIPYYALTLITLTILLIQPIKRFLGQLKFSFSFIETSTGYGVVNKAVVAAFIGFFYFRSIKHIGANRLGSIFMRTVEKTVPSTIAVVGLIVMSKVMGGTGQIEILAVGTANAMKGSYALVAPLVGVLGSFMTSSNMASNILFGKFQMTTASILNVPVETFLGAQTAGGAIGNTISPGNVILGTTTAGILGQEGKVLKTILPIAIASALFIGVILFVYLMII